MSQSPPRHPMTLKPVVLSLPGMEAIAPRRGIAYRESGGGRQTLEAWAPPGASPGDRRGAVLFVSGFPDPGLEKMLGCKLMEMESYVSWARLVAASGLVAITYGNQEPASDFQAALRYVHEHAGELGVDRDRIGVWAASGNAPNALSAVMAGAAVPIRAAALCYGYLLGVSEAAAATHFAEPCAGKTVADVDPSVPLLVVRAGSDQTPGLNASIDAFVAGALARDLPLTLMNLPGAAHAFDMLEDSERSRDAIRAILGFLRSKLAA